MQNKASRILMIRPVKFGFNDQTAGSNSFQTNSAGTDAGDIQQKALKEFDEMTALLSKTGIDTMIFEDTEEPHTPDSIFPNNWISFHENNELVLYSMLAENRRKEKREEIISEFRKKDRSEEH